MPLTVQKAISEFEDLLSHFAHNLESDDYLEVLEEISSRSTDAYNARVEEIAIELGKEEDDESNRD